MMRLTPTVLTLSFLLFMALAAAQADGTPTTTQGGSYQFFNEGGSTSRAIPKMGAGAIGIRTQPAPGSFTWRGGGTDYVPGLGPGSLMHTVKPGTGQQVAPKQLFGPGGILEYNPPLPAGSYPFKTYDNYFYHYPSNDPRWNRGNTYYNDYNDYAPYGTDQSGYGAWYPPATQGTDTAATTQANTDQPAATSWNGLLYVPTRDYFLALGVTAYWDETRRSAVAVLKDGRTVALPLEGTTISVDSKPVTLTAPTAVIGGVMMVPMLALSEALNISLQYDEATGMVYLVPLPAATAAKTETKPATEAKPATETRGGTGQTP